MIARSQKVVEISTAGLRSLRSPIPFFRKFVKSRTGSLSSFFYFLQTVIRWLELATQRISRTTWHPCRTAAVHRTWTAPRSRAIYHQPVRPRASKRALACPPVASHPDSGKALQRPAITEKKTTLKTIAPSPKINTNKETRKKKQNFHSNSLIGSRYFQKSKRSRSDCNNFTRFGPEISSQPGTFRSIKNKIKLSSRSSIGRQTRALFDARTCRNCTLGSLCFSKNNKL